MCAGALALGLAACCDASPDASSPAQRPNVLLVVLDTLRPDHLGLHGYTRPTSPHLDAFARDSFVFDAAQSSAPWTAPALISLMTSLYPDAHAVTSYPDPGRLSDSATTLAEILSAEGYATAAFTEGVYAAGIFGLDKGFDVYPPKPDADTPNLIEPNIDRFLEWLGAHDRSQPFFAFFHTYEPHYPYHAPPEFIQMMRPGYDEAVEHARRDELVDRWNRDKQLEREEVSFIYHHEWHCSDDLRKTVDDVAGLFTLAKEYGLDSERSLAADSQALATDYYDAGIRYADQQMQRVWSALDEMDLSDDTIVIVVSDHGEALGEHDLTAEHGKNLHDELLRIVLLMRVPGRGYQPRRLPDIVRNVDVLPTVLELTGVPLAGVKHQGVSLVPLLEGERREQVAFSHAPTTDNGKNRSHTLRTDRWRLLVRKTDGNSAGAPQLFDMLADPGATKDVAAAHPDIVRRLTALLEEQHKQDELLRRVFKDNTRDTPLTDEQLEELRALGYVGDR